MSNLTFKDYDSQPPKGGTNGGRRPVEGDAPRSVDDVLADEVHLQDYFRILYKRRWPALTIFLVVLLSVSIYTFTATPVYEAKVQILIEKEASNVVSFKEAVEQNQITDDYYQTQYKILQSRALARRTLESLKFWEHPEFGVASEKSRGSRSWLRTLFGSSSAPAPSEPGNTEETKRQSVVIDRFLSRVSVSPVRNSRLVDVRFEATEPALAARIANGIAANYIEQNLEYKFLSSKEASDWLGTRLGEQRKQVESSEQALQRYRERTDGGALEERQNIVVQKLADLNAAVTRAKTERIQKESAYNQIRAMQNDRTTLDTFPAILANSFVQQQKSELADLQRQHAQLSEKLGPNHPDMLKIGQAIRTAETKIQTEVVKVIQALRGDYEQAITQEKSLTAALDQQKREALDLNRKGIEYGVLARDAASNRQIFESLMQRTKETGISGELKTSNIRIVDAAEVPRRPSSPNTRNNLLMAIFGGSILAMGLAFFFEYLDNRFKNPEEVKRHLGLPFLGMVPALFGQDTVDPLINNGVPPNFSESFKALRTNVLFSSAEEGSRSIVVTSTGPGEGKTLVSSNLAIGLAQTGLRVLIIDADMRKPRVHTVFQKHKQPGLSNVLVASAKLSESVQPTMVSGLWMLPAGATPPNPAELLGSKRFADLMVSLSQHFDWIIVDTPPVMAVTDSAIVAHLTNGVVFVVGADMTSRYAAQHAVEQLDKGHAKFIGTVLNRVDLTHHSYYYSQYYKREYSDYYGQSDQPAKAHIPASESATRH